MESFTCLFTKCFVRTPSGVLESTAMCDLLTLKASERSGVTSAAHRELWDNHKQGLMLAEC